MKTQLFLLLLLLPGLMRAESAATSCDSMPAEQPVIHVESVPLSPAAKAALFPDDKKPYDWKKNGLFQVILHVGMNMAQIDGDAYNGYYKLGFDGGAGVQVRFHKYFSAIVELNYTQWGAKYSIISSADTSLGQRYRVKLNYVQVPVSINVIDKDIIMFSAGLNFSALVYYDERNETGHDITDTVLPQPKKFDLDAFAALHVIIKRQFAIGLKFSYSMIPFRGVEAQYARYTKIEGEYNNVLTFRFAYILSAVKKKHP